MHILVVDDDPDIRETLEQLLGEAGYLVSGAETGAAALRMAASMAPDLVLLDLMLPDLPGTEVCRSLRRDPQTRAVPVIMVSALSGEDNRVAGLELGADDYVQKPFSARELLLRIEAVLKRSRGHAGGARLDRDVVTAREQIRVWEGFSSNHYLRGEWRDCLEISRTILRRFGAQLTDPEIALLHDRVRDCDQNLHIEIDVDMGADDETVPDSYTRDLHET